MEGYDKSFHAGGPEMTVTHRQPVLGAGKAVPSALLAPCPGLTISKLDTA